MAQLLKGSNAYDFKAMGHNTAETIHVMTELQRRSFADRAEHMGDLAFYDVPVEMLVSKAHAAKWQKQLSMTEARSVNTSYSADSNTTTHMAAADADGNIISATHTIHAVFGCKASMFETRNAMMSLKR